MSSVRRQMLVGTMLFVAAARFLSSAFDPQVVGLVQEDSGPVERAIVGWQGSGHRVLTDANGRFWLPATSRHDRLIAHKPGHEIASASALDEPIVLRLRRLPREDHADYAWQDPASCGRCHEEIHREWLTSAHAHSARNPKFLHLFAGTDGTVPPHKTWNARQEHPDGAAVCAGCHVPTLTTPDLEYDIRAAQGDARSGIHCDYCHKVAAVPADKLGLRFGRDALFHLRPAPGEQRSFGPLDDAVRVGEAFAQMPVYKESRYCAACHEGTVFGVHAYGTYSEWLESPAKKQGKQCQDCHMAPTGKLTNIAPRKGGIERDPMTLASHHMPGGTLEMLKRSLKLTAQVSIEPNGRRVEVVLTAQDVGHRVPTGFVDRHLVLLIKAETESGQPVGSLEGERLPKSAGTWAGHAGVLYAKQLTGENNRTPSPFWLPVYNSVDTRLKPGEPDRRVFRFPAAARRISVQLWYRRFWQEIADMRGWRDNEVLIAERHLSGIPD